MINLTGYAILRGPESSAELSGPRSLPPWGARTPEPDTARRPAESRRRSLDACGGRAGAWYPDWPTRAPWICWWAANDSGACTHPSLLPQGAAEGCLPTAPEDTFGPRAPQGRPLARPRAGCSPEGTHVRVEPAGTVERELGGDRATPAGVK
ncbi:hypothetical protein GCM10022207_44870 [Streptomyces lannensis]|uniref:Uncharacterized protein n=1 Tax=Streptomyces lannensis TaxID=766498 RepID=A0ABP7KE33_9ACTN